MRKLNRNGSPQNGGTMSVVDSDLEMYNSYFENQDSQNGAVLYAKEYNDQILTIGQSTRLLAAQNFSKTIKRTIN